MKTIPMHDLKNTAEVERLCAEENGPVFVTKNGCGRLVVMDIDFYDKTMRKINEAKTILGGLKDIKSENIVKGDAAISNIRSKYGI
ncbi:type II toxin-antitoxin system Phd/YefM family antitoxin [Catenibacterium sp.]|uniref:type II toxin-antitoxin system Phd/YefM family antitoxin n=1 Tax=Catenibacterium sp. TaxID=2049022 RepID=UPI0040250BE0